MNKYKVIWFDDEHETRKKIRERAHLSDITLVGFSNAKEGIEELRNNIKAYDAALLDGIFFQNPSEKGIPSQDDAMGDVAKELLRLENHKKLPWFILSGQDSFTKEKNRFAESFKDGQVFDKYGNDEHYNFLWESIKKEADKLPEAQVRQNNNELFEIFKVGYLSNDVEEIVLQLFIGPLPENNSELKAVLTAIRSVQESCFLKLKSINVLPDDLTSFNKQNKHLSGNIDYANEYKARTTVYQSKEIENLNSWIYFTCGTYIHSLEKQHYGGYMISNYAVQSLRSGLFELLLWFKQTYHENN